MIKKEGTENAPVRRTRPRMTDVAALADVSPITVSRAFKTPERVSKEARLRIFQAVETLGYVLDQTAGTLSSNRSGFVAALLPSLNNSNFSETARGLTEAIEAGGLQLLLGYTDYAADKEDTLVETMLRRRPEGIVVTGGQHTERVRRRLLNAAIPVVETWDVPVDPLGHVVGFSNAGAAYAMVRRLVERGYRDIGFIGGSSLADTRGADRRLGYQRAIADMGLPEGRTISFGQPLISMEQGGEAIVRLLEHYPSIDAVVCVSDLSAFGAIMECHRRGWSVPGRIAVAGFGDFEVSRYCHPRITTVAVDCYEIGRTAGEIVLRSIIAHRGGEMPPPETVEIPFSVIEREST